MIRSMTGYGEADRETPYGRLRAEVRTVNHRFFTANVRLIRAAERFEPQIRDCLRAHLPRGAVNFTLRREDVDGGGEAVGVRVDEVRARAYLNALRSLKSRLDLPGDVDLAAMLRFGDVLVPEEAETAAALDVDTVVELAASAASATIAMREAEGARLAEDLEDRLRGMEAALAGIGRRGPARLVAERDRIHRVVAELLEDVSVDEDRLAREIAYLAERWDVSEELVRLRSHIELFRQLLGQDADEPVGKRLSFLVQEMNREANTIGSKANDAPMEHHVVAVKDEIERLREQVENIE